MADFVPATALKVELVVDAVAADVVSGGCSVCAALSTELFRGSSVREVAVIVLMCALVSTPGGHDHVAVSCGWLGRERPSVLWIWSVTAVVVAGTGPTDAFPSVTDDVGSSVVEIDCATVSGVIVKVVTYLV